MDCRRATSPVFRRQRKKTTVFIRNFDDFTAMADTFEGIQELPNPVAGCPNFRRVPSYKVYSCGQPTVAGFEAALSKVCGDTYPRDGKIVWINTRQEPCVYVNGEPICARPPEKIGKFAEIGNATTESVTRDEFEFLKLCVTRKEDNGGKLKYLDVNEVEKEVEVKTIITLGDVVKDLKEVFPGLVYVRVPMAHGAAPKEPDFDAITANLVGTGFNTPVIVSDHLGDARATTGSVIACIFKEFQVSASYDGLIASIPEVDIDVLKMDNYKADMAKDPMVRGYFNVINQLLESNENAKYAKKECDKIIDKAGTVSTKGSGLVQLREDIAQAKLSYEIMEDSEQVILKAKIMDNIEKYFYLIVFTMYMREEIMSSKDATSDISNTLKSGKHSIPADQLQLQKTFTTFMQEHNDLRYLIEEGKGDLKWERDIPVEAWNNLVNLSAEDFKGNLGKIINNIFQLAHSMFTDLPIGPDKKRATYRFASKTLLKLLPAKEKSEVDMLISKKRMALDLYDILGHCTWKK
jgi:hypothetical protein